MLSRDRDCLLPVEEAGVLWDSVCFLFLLLQRRVFLSRYFLHVSAELQATALQASRSVLVPGPPRHSGRLCRAQAPDAGPGSVAGWRFGPFLPPGWPEGAWLRDGPPLSCSPGGRAGQAPVTWGPAAARGRRLSCVFPLSARLQVAGGVSSS